LEKTKDTPPCNGNVKGILLLVDFSDEPNTIPPAEVESSRGAFLR